jgi:hypothetical protein
MIFFCHFVDNSYTGKVNYSLFIKLELLADSIHFIVNITWFMSGYYHGSMVSVSDGDTAVASATGILNFSLIALAMQQHACVEQAGNYKWL